jgi:hypothetical protein
VVDREKSLVQYPVRGSEWLNGVVAEGGDEQARGWQVAGSSPEGLSTYYFKRATTNIFKFQQITRKPLISFKCRAPKKEM